MVRLLFVLWSVLAAIHLSATPLPTEYFAQLPDVERVTLSPNGEKLAAVVRVDVEDMQGTGVQVTDLEKGEADMVFFSDNTEYFIYSVHWKDSRTLLVHSYSPSRRDEWTKFGYARFNTRDTQLMIIDTETGKMNTPFNKFFLRKFPVLPSTLDSIVDTLPEDPDHLLMVLPSTTIYGTPAVYKVNIRKQQATVVHEAVENIYGWGTDRQSRIRVGYYFKDGMHKTLLHDLKTNEWRELWPYETFSEDQVSVAGFGHDPNELFIYAYHNGRLALFRVDLQDPELKRTLVLDHPEYDITGGLIYSPSLEKVIGVSDAGGEGSYFFEETLQSLKRGIDKLMPDSSNHIYNLTEDLQSYLLYTSGHRESGTYYLGKRNPAELEAVAYRYKNLPPDVLGPVRDYPYQARDGLAIEAQLTLPPTGKDKNLPTIMFPHGGPHARDTAAFDYWAQFFANRGYAVLQMNFRGSAGQGVEFRNAGLQNWGKEMQDDIEDGARQLIKDGITDPDRICIAGASYGGYAALMGAVKTPDFYQCAISVNGVSNVFDLVRDNRNFRASYNVADQQIGKLGTDLKEVSPVNHADKIKIPVLLIHGDLDRQVDIKHSEQMRDALQKEDKSVTFLSLANEDHYLSNEQNRLETFRTMERFLTQHLPVESEGKSPD